MTTGASSGHALRSVGELTIELSDSLQHRGELGRRRRRLIALEDLVSIPVYCCGGLPVTTAVLSVHFCHQHQAWVTRYEVLHQRDDDHPQILRTTSCGWGPFDSHQDVLRWLTDRLVETEQLPDAPQGIRG